MLRHLLIAAALCIGAIGALHLLSGCDAHGHDCGHGAQIATVAIVVGLVGLFALGRRVVAAVVAAFALALAGCGAMQTAEAEVVVDGWGLSASCKSDHVCVETPIAPLCWPIPAKLAERVCRV